MMRRACVAAHSSTVAETFAHFGGEVLPAGVAVLARDHELRVALRQRQADSRQMRSRTRDGSGVTGGDVAREFLRLFTEGLERRTSGRDFEVVIATSFHESPVPR